MMGEASTSLVWEGVAGATLQAIVLTGGGLWAWYIFRRRREFKPHVRVGLTARVVAKEHGHPAHLFLRLHMVNESGGRSQVGAYVVLWEVTTTSNDYPQFKEIARDFPLDYSHGDVAPGGVLAGPGVSPITNWWLEPSECIESEVLFCPDPCPALMAVRASLEHQRTRRSRWRPWTAVLQEAVLWETFAYVDLDALAGAEYVALTSHEAST